MAHAPRSNLVTIVLIKIPKAALTIIVVAAGVRE